MLDEIRIKATAEKAAAIAHSFLGLDCPYSIALIDKPGIAEDALLDTQQNEIQINLALLKPFSAEEMPSMEPRTEEEREQLENYRHMMKVNYLVFHEMRHLYQKKTVEAYMINQSLGAKLVPQLESDKKCQLWLEGLKDGVGEVEEDANDFAYYLTNRYPIQRPMVQKSRRLAAMKRKYDKVPIPDTNE